MRVISSIKFEDVNDKEGMWELAHFEEPEFRFNPTGIASNEYFEVEVVCGERYRDMSGCRQTIGFSNQAKLALGLSYEVMMSANKAYNDFEAHKESARLTRIRLIDSFERYKHRPIREKIVDLLYDIDNYLGQIGNKLRLA